MPLFRALKNTEIELRVAQSGKSSQGVWANYLIYKDARVDQNILDETVGPDNWEKSYELIDQKMYCTVSIWDKEKQQWIKKQDVGTESNTEKEKGEASDAFKRACFCWGIGRELYTAPSIFISLNEGEYTENNGKIQPKARLFTVSEIESAVDGVSRIITKLVITDRKGAVRFSFKGGRVNTAKAKAEQPLPKAAAESETLSAQRDRIQTPTEVSPLPDFNDDRHQAIFEKTGFALPVYRKICEKYAAGQPAKSGREYDEEFLAQGLLTEQEVDVFRQDAWMLAKLKLVKQ